MIEEKNSNSNNILDSLTLYEVYEVINFFSKQKNEEIVKIVKKINNINIKGIVKDVDVEGKIKVIYIKDNKHRKGLKINIPKELISKTLKISPEDLIKIKIKIQVKGEIVEFLLLEIKKIRL
jgi:hypothetical protein